MPTELADNATHDEITSYVDKVVADVEADRAGDDTAASSTTDSGKLAAETDQVLGDTSADEKSGSEKPADKGDDAGKPEGREWLDDELKTEVAAYGIDEKLLADFASREEVERALRLFDRNALEVGRKALAESEPGKPDESGKARDEQGRFAKPEGKKEAKASEKPSDGRYEVALSTDEFDDRLVGELERMRDHYESRLEALESRFVASDARAEEQRFDSAVDALDMPKLFGKTGSESVDELQRREDLLVQVKAQQIGLKKLTGRDSALDALVARVAPMVFAEEFDKHKLKSRTRKISKQSNGRQGGGTTRPTDPPETVRDEMRRLYEELEKA